MGAGRVVAVVLGSLVLLVGIALLFGGGALVGIDRGFTDANGFLTVPSTALERDTYAVVGQAFFEGEWIWWYRNPTTVRVQMTGDQPVFVGIGPRADIDAYLADVSYAEIEDIDFREDRRDRVWASSYEDHIGSNAPARPGDQTFWQAVAEGEGPQTVLWTIEPGDWSSAMNRSRTWLPGVTKSASRKLCRNQPPCAS